MVISVRIQFFVIMSGMQIEIKMQVMNFVVNFFVVRESVIVMLLGEIKGL